ncbi:unnamed protein product [Staurois parvus]|uniref:Uncharacterized protein n=1 Tax=Staurois parvus TaxID=386267 RepID=A0ABN9BGC0_9NEOB|nr:unnamed protein product [Staurois parvus]
MRQQQWGGRTGTHERLWTWRASSMRRRYGGPIGRLRAWQQQWEARICQHPMTKRNTPAV